MKRIRDLSQDEICVTLLAGHTIKKLQKHAHAMPEYNPAFISSLPDEEQALLHYMENNPGFISRFQSHFNALIDELDTLDAGYLQ